MISFIYNFFETVQSFMSRGGGVLYLIFTAIFVLWALAVERFWYFKFHLKKDSEQFIQDWQSYSVSGRLFVIVKNQNS